MMSKHGQLERLEQQKGVKATTDRDTAGQTRWWSSLDKPRQVQVLWKGCTTEDRQRCSQRGTSVE